MALGDWIRDAFAFLGPGGILAAMFLIFLVDAAIFPALPEVFIVLFYQQLVDLWSWSSAAAAGSLLVLALAGDLCGNAGMYGIMKWFHARGKVPKVLERAMKKWTSFLAVRDERIILVNRIAPAVPFTPALFAVLVRLATRGAASAEELCRELGTVADQLEALIEPNAQEA